MRKPARPIRKRPEILDSSVAGDLLHAVESNRLAIVVGTGVSLAACGNQHVDGFPVASWSGLIRHGVKRCREDGLLQPGEDQVLEQQVTHGVIRQWLNAADTITDAMLGHSPAHFARWLKETIGNLEPRDVELIDAIAGVGGILTTLNYDTLVEKVARRVAVSWREQSRVEAVLRDDPLEAAGERRHGVLHLHGVWEDPQSVVLGLRSYEKVKAAQHMQTALRALLLDRTLLFVGCRGTFEDPNFRHLADWVRESRSEATARHYLLHHRAEAGEIKEFLAKHAPWLTPLCYGEGRDDLAPFLRELRLGPAARDRDDPSTKAALERLHQLFLVFCRGGGAKHLALGHDAACRMLAAQYDLPVGELKRFLKNRLVRTTRDPAAAAKEKLRALREAGEFSRARDFAAQQAGLLDARDAAAREAKIALWLEAIDCDLILGDYDLAESHARAAAMLADQNSDFRGWSRVQFQLGRVLIRKRQDRRAVTHHEKLWQLQRRRLGRNDEDTLATRNSLAVALSYANRCGEAERHHRAVLEARTVCLGSTDVRTLASRNNLAGALCDLRRYAEAARELRAALKGRIAILGPTAPDTLLTRNNLALAWHHLGQHVRAEREFREVLAIRGSVLPPEHPDIFQSLQNLALCLEARGKFSEALGSIKQAVEGYRDALGASHPETLACQLDLRRIRAAAARASKGNGASEN